MNIKFQDPGFQYSINSIMMFQTEEQSDWWKESLFYFYPNLDQKYFDSLSQPKRERYLEETLADFYMEHQPNIKEKIQTYQKYWNCHKSQIEEALSDAFQINVQELFPNLVANVTLNPISPRFLSEHSFDIFHLNSEKGALGVSIHELIHFVWFYVWHHHFHDSYEEYESPNLKWIFSEMVVEPIMRDPRLSSINPYFKTGCVYDYFYTMKIEGKPILDTINRKYKTLPITTFMEEGYDYCLTHEKEIRMQIK